MSISSFDSMLKAQGFDHSGDDVVENLRIKASVAGAEPSDSTKAAPRPAALAPSSGPEFITSSSASSVA